MLKLERDKDGTVTAHLSVRLPRVPEMRRVAWLECEPSPILLLLIPILALSGDRSPVFNFAGYLDAWIYYALFRQPVALYHLFPKTYYGSRLSAVLPGYAVNSILPPLAANYFLHVAVWFAAVISLYVVIKSLAGARTALMSATAFGFYPYLWKATGWDYPDGIGIAYYLLTMALLTLASERQVPPRRLLFFSGLSVAGAVYSNLTWAFLVPCFVLYWLFLRKARGLPLAVFRAAAWPAGGVCVLTLAFALVNHHWAGFYWFYSPSIHYALNAVGDLGPHKARDWSWIWHATWLYLPSMALVGGLVACSTARWRQGTLQSRMVLGLYANLLFCAGVLISWELAGNPVLQIFYYASYLLPPVFVFLGVTSFSVSDGISDRKFYGLLGCAVASFSLVWWDRQGVTWHWLLGFGQAVPIVAAAGAVIAGAALRRRSGAVALSLFGVCVLSFLSRVITPYVWGTSPAASEDAFMRIVHAMEICEKNRGGEAPRFWYDRKDPNVYEFASIASTYLYGYSLIGIDFPSIDRASIDRDPKGVLAILSSVPDAAEKARGALKSLDYAGDVMSDDVIESGGIQYTLTLIRVHEDTTVPSDGRYVKNGDFESGVESWFGGWATLRARDGGQSGKCLELQAEQGPSQYALLKLRKIASGSRYKLSFWVKSGSSGDEPFVVGLWDAEGARWQASRSGRSSPNWTEFEVEFTNSSNNQLGLEIMKNSPTKGTMLFDSVQLVVLKQ